MTIRKTQHPKYLAIGATESPKTFSAKTLGLLARNMLHALEITIKY